MNDPLTQYHRRVQRDERRFLLYYGLTCAAIGAMIALAIACFL